MTTDQKTPAPCILRDPHRPHEWIASSTTRICPGMPTDLEVFAAAMLSDHAISTGDPDMDVMLYVLADEEGL